MTISNNSNTSNTEFNNLNDIFAFLVASKFAIVIITFLFTVVTSSYLIFNKPQPIYKSSALIEVGEYFDNVEKQNKLIEASSDLNNELNKIFINRYLYDSSNENFVSVIEQIQEGLIKLEARSSSIEQSEKSILEIIDYVINRHENYYKNITDQSNQIFSAEKETLINSLSGLKIRANHIKNIEIPSININSSNSILDLNELEEFIRESIKNNPELNLELLKNQMNLIENRIEKIDENVKFMKSNSNFKNSRQAGQIISTIEPQLSSKIIIISSFIFGLFVSCFIILVANSIMSTKR